MMRLHAIKFQGHITIYFNTICMIIQSILFILSFNIYRNSDLVFNIKYTRYFLQCFSIIAYIFLPENEMVKNNVKIIYWVLIFNHVSYFYYIDLDYITFPLIPIINTSAIIYAQIYHNFDKCYLFTEIGLSITFGIITFFYKKSEHIDKKKSFFESYQKEKDIQYMIELIDNNNSNLIILKKDHDITFLNKNALKFLNKIDNPSKEIQEFKENEIFINDKNLNLKNRKFFTSLKLKKLEHFQESNAGESFYEILSNYLKDEKYINNNQFIKLDYFYFENEGIPGCIEIYARILKFHEDVIEFLIYDVTQIKLIEKNSIEANYKKKILEKIGHEFKSPSISILSLINQIFKQQNNPDSFQFTKKNLNHILNLTNFNIFQTNNLIQYLSDLVNSRFLSKGEVNLSEVMNFSYEILKTLVECNDEIAEKVETKLLIQEEIWIVTDENLLKLIILNLISNSVKFTKSGYIQLEVKKSSKTKTIKIKVTDTGIGIKEEDKHLIFQDKVQLNIEDDYNVKGSVLGLSLCKNLIKSLEFEIGFKSKHKVGSTFYINLKNENIIKTRSFSPKVKIIEEKKFIKEEILSLKNEVRKEDKMMCKNFQEEIFLKKKKFDEDLSFRDLDENSVDFKSKFSILVIDDQNLVRESTVNLIKKILIDHNILDYSILEGSDGIDLLYLIKEDYENRIKCIFIDENMKYLMGSEAVKILRKLQDLNKINNYYIASVTAFEDEQTKKEISKSGINTIIGKPCTKSSIFSVLKHVNIIS